MSLPGFDPSFENQALLASLKSCETTNGDGYIYIYIYIYNDQNYNNN